MNTTLHPHQLDHDTTNHTDTVLDGYRVTEGFGTGPGHHRLVCDDNAAVLASLAKTGESFDLIFADPPYNTGRSRDTYRNAFEPDEWHQHVLSRLQASQKVLAHGGTIALTIDSRCLAAALAVVEQLCDASSGWWYQIVTATTNPSGAAMKGFRRCHEFFVFIHTPSARPTPAVLGEHWGITGEEKTAGTVQWNRLLKSGIGHTAASSPGCFYPVYLHRATGKILGVGQPVSPKGYKKFNDPDPTIATCWPIRKDGSLGRWRVSAETASALLQRGFLSIGRLVLGAEEQTAIKYLTSGTVAKIDTGQFQVTEYDATTGAAHIAALDTEPALLPSTVWSVASHNYSAYGSWLVRKMVPESTFSHPKSVYAMEDVLRFFAATSDAKILDLYAGSGTVAHAVMLANASDGGHRSSVSITLNEVGSKGHVAGHTAGVFEAVLVPRIRAASSGLTAAGDPVTGQYDFPVRGPISDGLAGTVAVLEPSVAGL